VRGILSVIRRSLISANGGMRNSAMDASPLGRREMSAVCPTCKQPWPQALSNDASLLLELLTRKHGRYVYQGHKYGDPTGRWYLTHSLYGESTFSFSPIQELIKQGLLHPCYSNSNQAYWLLPTVDVEAVLAQRREEKEKR
jgi:hypothetical protein